MSMTDKNLTREKHLDHMVKVVPLIVFAYAIQCYFIMKMGETDATASGPAPLALATNGLLFLGACLALMIAAFVIYDLTHSVKFHDDFLTVSIKWLRYERTVAYSDIKTVKVGEPGQTFTTLSFTTAAGEDFRFFFVDEADKIKKWLEDKSQPEKKMAA